MAAIHDQLSATVKAVAAFAGVFDQRRPVIRSDSTADTRPLVDDPFNTGLDLSGWEILDRLARSESAVADAGWTALGEFIDAFLINDIGAAELALCRARDAAVRS